VCDDDRSNYDFSDDDDDDDDAPELVHIGIISVVNLYSYLQHVLTHLLQKKTFTSIVSLLIIIS
jgi:hypothetical protein